MIDRIKKLLIAHWELISYFVVGVAVTLVNWVVYALLMTHTPLGINPSNVLAWAAAVLVAFLLNKAVVFRSKNWSPRAVIREAGLFVGGRLFSGIVEIVMLPVLLAVGITQSFMGVEGFVAKFLAGFLSMVINYFISKYAIFKKPVPAGAAEPAVEFHADDYGLFPAQSRRILACREGGCLNGVSVMPNSPHLAGCMPALDEGVAVAVHLNLVEGRSLCPPEEVALLVDGDGVFRCSFGSLLIRPLFSWQPYKQQIKKELRAQIQAVRDLRPDRPLRLDSHCHYHMLPVVFDSLMEVLAEEGWPVEYIRIPREHLGIYLRRWTRLEGLRPINFVKVAVLNVLSWWDMARHRAYMAGPERRLFFGVLLSGHMTAKNVQALLPGAVALAKRRGQGVEILAHPGGVEEPEDIARLTSKDDVAFLTSELRKKEAEMFRSIRKEGEGK